MSIIPKTIHYCWFGKNEMPLELKKYVDGWKDKLHDYKFILWDENSFNIRENDFVSEAYDNKMWAFVSDYVRLMALYENGGIYLDTDVEVINSFDRILNNDAFAGFESRYNLGSAIVGSKKNNKWIKNLLDIYNDKHFIKEDGKLDKTPNTKYFTDITVSDYGLKLNNKLQHLNNVTIYPRDYFYSENLYTRKTKMTDNSICIHHWNGSWVDDKTPTIKSKIRNLLYATLGDTITEEAYKVYWKMIKK